MFIIFYPLIKYIQARICAIGRKNNLHNDSFFLLCRFFNAFQRTVIAVCSTKYEQHGFELVDVNVAHRCVIFVKMRSESL